MNEEDPEEGKEEEEGKEGARVYLRSTSGRERWMTWHGAREHIL